jgi:hypothetical protein
MGNSVVLFSPHLCFYFFGRPLTAIQKQYGPYVTGAYFVLKLGGAVKYDKGFGLGSRGRDGVCGGRDRHL